jgi:uncharacterized membrane protein
LDFGCPLNLVSINQSVVDASSNGSMLGATDMLGVLLLLIAFFIHLWSLVNQTNVCLCFVHTHAWE